MCKEIASIHGAEKKTLFELRVVYHDNKQESHDHGMFSQ